jgi:hypothetical protein
MRTMTVAVIAFALALPGAAQQSPSPYPAPALVHDFYERPDDSRLVRAAKRSLALRQKGTGRSSGWVVNDAMVRHLHVDNAPSAPQQAAGEVPANAASAAQPPVNRPALEKKLQDAREEMARMAQESNETYAGDIEEDKINQRLTQLPNEIETLNKQLQPAPPPAPPSKKPQ